MNKIKSDTLMGVSTLDLLFHYAPTSIFSVAFIFELGRYIVSHDGYYATEVLDIEKNHGRYFVILRGGTHHLRLPA
ncbi:hypothetical protein [Thermaerobacillus caldiproteolyticus]|uniref:Diaminopimelate decarboxylase n=1 Tax=Thermaerobacillus caldiproteolyticus TaxID=247480 RepID=A0A7V9ZA32_9BACL|nr:hypothetical protein [Anoxybacillus caldiproteolyticus]MBA2876661.1 diaminopimelate decarboxylase [Anoxybacillus caldiproteolyticus]